MVVRGASLVMRDGASEVLVLLVVCDGVVGAASR